MFVCLFNIFLYRLTAGINQQATGKRNFVKISLKTDINWQVNPILRQHISYRRNIVILFIVCYIWYDGVMSAITRVHSTTSVTNIAFRITKLLSSYYIKHLLLINPDFRNSILSRSKRNIYKICKYDFVCVWEREEERERARERYIYIYREKDRQTQSMTARACMWIF